MAKASPPFPLMLVQRSIVIGLCLVLSFGEAGARAAEAIAIAQDAPQPAAPVDTSPAALDQLLAPIALYPDALLMQVLAASVNSQEVLDAGNWLLENKSLEGAQLDAAAKQVGFGAAMTALLHFPDVVDMMCTELDWTQQLGAAFDANQAAVLDSVQRLRAEAVQYGNLKTTPQQQVLTQQDNGKQVIVIQPANPQVVYVPQYNPETVYVGPSAGDVAAASILSFGVGIAIGSLFSNNNYYYPRWGYGGVYYGGRPWVPSRYSYRPIYGPRWRPATGYRPPANYPYHRASYNNNYFNRYRGGNNNGGRPGNNNRPGNGYNGSRPVNNTRPSNGYNGNKNPSAKPASGNNGRPGNGGYNGNTGSNNRPGNGAANSGNSRPGNSGSRPANTNGRPATPSARPAPDRGYAKPANAAQQPRPGASRPATQQQKPASRPAQQASRSASALSPGSSGKSANAASQRGAASRRNK